MDRSFDRPFVLAPERSFDALARDLRALGWSRDDTAPFTPSLVLGEPELAGFRRGDAHLVYTFQPVVALRVLAPRGITSDDVLELERGLALVGARQVASWLSSQTERDVLRGLLAAPILGACELLPQVERALSHPHEAIRRAAERAIPELERAAQPRIEARALLRVIAERARPILADLARDPAGVAAFRPRDEDFARVFAPDVVGRACRAFGEIWTRVPEHDVPARMTELDVDASTAGMFSMAPPSSFPQGYRAIARALAPDRVWITWRFREPEASAGIRFDGLVAIDDRCIWLPKPYRVLAPRDDRTAI